MSRLRAACLTLVLLSSSSPALASYQDGFWGLVVLFFTVPAGLLAIALTFFLRELNAFRHVPVFVGYVLLMLGAAAVPVAVSMSAQDDASTLMVLAATGLLLVPILLPALKQRARWRESLAAGEAAAPGPGDKSGQP